MTRLLVVVDDLVGLEELIFRQKCQIRWRRLHGDLWNKRLFLLHRLLPDVQARVGRVCVCLCTVASVLRAAPTNSSTGGLCGLLLKPRASCGLTGAILSSLSATLCRSIISLRQVLESGLFGCSLTSHRQLLLRIRSQAGYI